MELWLVILFIRREKFHAKQICVLSNSVKLGPNHRPLLINAHQKITVMNK